MLACNLKYRDFFASCFIRLQLQAVTSRLFLMQQLFGTLFPTRRSKVIVTFAEFYNCIILEFILALATYCFASQLSKSKKFCDGAFSCSQLLWSCCAAIDTTCFLFVTAASVALWQPQTSDQSSLAWLAWNRPLKR